MAVGDSATGGVTDGRQIATTDSEPFTKQAGPRDAIDTGSIYLRSTANTDKVAVMVRTLTGLHSPSWLSKFFLWAALGDSSLQYVIMNPDSVR